ncbi:MAG: SDR family NAD(P)-dependent oxidoreductase [Hyphomonas sp.]|uniref:SDR family NAD(P)-dependent oxidoreductase n=1 Tax=Hyphomonas sp. TaxID=87 RepID=UPI003527DE79
MKAIVFGTSGGLGRALAQGLVARGRHHEIYAVSRHGDPLDGAISLAADFTDEPALAGIARKLIGPEPLALCLFAGGLLSDGAGLQPEKTYRHQTAANFQRVFEANTIAPALVAKHMLPLMPKHGRSVFAALSARVGSISDNRLGGWHAYRASKSALNMLIRNYAIEQAHRAPGCICVALHPGTVDTRLSRPFQANVPGGRLFPPQQSAAYLLDVIDRLGPDDSGKCLDWGGREIPS